jgi:hypothetical protein
MLNGCVKALGLETKQPRGNRTQRGAQRSALSHLLQTHAGYIQRGEMTRNAELRPKLIGWDRLIDEHGRGLSHSFEHTG